MAPEPHGGNLDLIQETQDIPTDLASVHPTSPPSPSASFPLFPHLPTELRLKIWSLASSSQNKPRLHVLDVRGSRFISNQPLSPFLSTCRDSRFTHLSVTKSQFAFETYVNYLQDIFYFTDLARVSVNLGKLYAFLSCEDARPIQRFAVKRELFDRTHTLFPDGLDELKEVLIVWRDWRPKEVAWRERGAGFVEVERAKEGELLGQGRMNGHTAFMIGQLREKFGGKNKGSGQGEGVGGRRVVRFCLGYVE